MKGKFIQPNPLNPEMKSAIRFEMKKAKYNFISSLYYWVEENGCYNEYYGEYEDHSYFTGRFDFDYNNSIAVTNKGLKAINSYKKFAFKCIENLFELGAEFIEIGAAPYKQEKRLKLYERLLKEHYSVEYVRSDMFIIRKFKNEDYE